MGRACSGFPTDAATHASDLFKVLH